MIGSQANEVEDKWHEGEYQSLVKHFEEIYKISVTSITLLITGGGAAIAYGGATTISGGIICLLFLIWYFSWTKIIRKYTYSVVCRLLRWRWRRTTSAISPAGRR